MLEAASPVQTAGFGLPVVAVAATTTRMAAEVASSTGAMRHGLSRPIDLAAYRGKDGGGEMRSRATLSRHSKPGSILLSSVLGMRTRFLF